MLMVVALAATVLAGCLDDDNNSLSSGQGISGSAEDDAGKSVHFSGSGQWQGEIDEKTLDCDGDGTLRVSASGQGDFQVRVTDADDEEIGSFTFSGQGAEQDTESLDGAPGTWTITVGTGYYMVGPIPVYPKGYQGAYDGTVAC